MNTLNTITETACTRENLVNDLLTFQQEMAAIAFNGENDKAKIWDIISNLKAMNEIHHCVSEDTMATFEKMAKKFGFRIKKEIATIRGQKSVRELLESFPEDVLLLQDVCIAIDKKACNIGDIVITRKGICILELMCLRLNIAVNKEGQCYYINGNKNGLAGNLLQDLKHREDVLRTVLQNAGICNPNISSLVVFTDNRSVIKNKHGNLKTIFLGQLSDALKNLCGWNLYSTNTMDTMFEIIRSLQCEKISVPDTDLQALKETFLAIYNTLEEAESRKATEKDTFFARICNLFKKNDAVPAA